MTGMYTYHL